VWLQVRAQFDLRVFVDADADTRLVRRLRRDIASRGRSVQAVLEQYERTVKPSFELYIAPTKQHADIIIPRGADNTVAIELLWQHIRFRVAQADTRELHAEARDLQACGADCAAPPS
jgi:uridine kinase